MKRILSVFVFVMICYSTVFAGDDSVFKTVKKAVDVGGYVNSVAKKGQYISDNQDLKKIEEATDPIGVASDIKDVASVATTGAAVVGASGSGIMSTMAATGAAVGGGVVAGTAITAGAGGFGTASLMNKYVFDGNTEADKAAHVGTKAGAAVGTVASVGTLAVVGAGPAGLATIGAAVGGGMAAGAVVVLAAPVAAAAVVGGAVYWFFKGKDKVPEK